MVSVKASALLLVAAVALAAPVAHGGDHNEDQNGSHDGPHGDAPMDMNMDMASPTESLDAASSPMATNSAMATAMDGHMDGHTDDAEMEPSPMSMQMHHGRPVLNDPDLEPQQRKYWEMYNTTNFFTSPEGNKPALYAHTLLTVLAWALLYPVTLLISTNARAQRVYVPLQTAQSAISVAALFFLAVYGSSAPDLYPQNAYSKFSWALLVFVIVHWCAMIMRAITSFISYSRLDGYEEPRYGDDDLSHPASPSPAGDYMLSDFSRQSGDGSSSTEYDFDQDAPSTPDLEAAAAAALSARNKRKLGDDEWNIDEESLGASHKTAPVARPSALVQRLANNKFVSHATAAIGGLASILFHTLNIPLFFLGATTILMGAATGFCMGKGHAVFALLAHFIKGFVFFALGFVELARYFGAFSGVGMAWNAVAAKSSRDNAKRGILARMLHFWPNLPTMEYWQCFLIFVYGTTNIFLEHLGNSDGLWTHKDLQHASIAFMFIGGGASGLILESACVRNSLSNAFGFKLERESAVRTYSINPMPALTIFWTGALMSRHQQETALSTAIHVQWGSLLCLAAVLRLGTLMILTLKKHRRDTFGPQRPFTELLVSFCLICGGMIFMLSQRETTEAMIYRGLDSMFMLNVSVGVTTLFMSYATLTFVFRGWAIRRQ